jgi:hypothetical protein
LRETYLHLPQWGANFDQWLASFVDAAGAF